MNFFDSYYEVAAKIKSTAARHEFIGAVVDYYYSGGVEHEFKNDIAAVGFEGIRLSLDNSITNSRNRSGAKRKDNGSRTKAKRNDNESETKQERDENEHPNQLPDEKEKGKEIVVTDVTTTPKAPYAEIVGMLNEATGAQFRASSKKTQSLINARMREGFTADDFRAVIHAKAKEWGNDAKMRMYLRPETLFGTKFESYLNQGRLDAAGRSEYGIYD